MTHLIRNIGGEDVCILNRLKNIKGFARGVNLFRKCVLQPVQKIVVRVISVEKQKRISR